MRQLMKDYFKRLIVGPWEEGESLSGNPRSVYSSGMLWPSELHAEQYEDHLEGDEEYTIPDETDVDETHSTRTFGKKPSSLGLSFFCEGRFINVIVKGAVYEKIVCEDDQGATSEYWERIPIDKTLERINLSEGIFDIDEGFDARISVRVEIQAAGSGFYVSVFLQNKASLERDQPIWAAAVPDNKVACRDCDYILFQSGLIIECLEDTIITPYKSPIPSLELTHEELMTNLLYRKCQEYGFGHGVAVNWSESDAQAQQQVSRIQTTWVPEAQVKEVSRDGHTSLGDLGQDTFKASFLADGDKTDVLQNLKEFTEVYKKWISDRESEVENWGDAEEKETASLAIENCKNCLGNIVGGLDLLRKNDNVYKAFQLSNSAMNLQVVFAGGSELRWYPFQLAFLLKCIDSVIDTKSNHRDTMDLLWFPTGGGKTEAYLGLIAFSIFYHRLTDENQRENPNVHVLMRYTLRLLTAQQFERASKLVCAAELIRQEHVDDLGTVPISIGLYVGGDATPNKIEEAKKILDRQHASETTNGTVLPIQSCPVCKHEVTPLNNIRIDENEVRAFCVNLECGDAAGVNGFYNPRNQVDESCNGVFFPIFAVDEQIYKVLPTLIIATVDKFAQLPRRNELGLIFGSANKLPPNLIVQDELHLISGPLGSMAGVYEAVIDSICMTHGSRPKIIGSTATITRASDQVKLVFDREISQFPPSCISADDAFFATVPDNPKTRLYLGVSCGANSGKFMLQAATAALLQAAMKIRCDQPGSERSLDPYWSVIAYFGSMRELAAGDNAVRDVVPDSIDILASLIGCEKRDLSRGLDVLELTSRTDSYKISEVLMKLGIRLDQSETNCANVILATNMISVGMDIPRMGLMIVNGQPKSTAEYIQASSRVGRAETEGLVVTNFNVHRPRDLSHFEHFQTYHQAFYKQVETTSVNPWSPTCISRTLPAAIVGYLRQVNDALELSPTAICNDNVFIEIQNNLRMLFQRIFRAQGIQDDEIELLTTDGIDTTLNAMRNNEMMPHFENASPEAVDILRQGLDFILRWRALVEGNQGGEVRYYTWEDGPVGLLSNAEEVLRRSPSLPKGAPNNMRSVEPSSAIVDSEELAVNKLIRMSGTVRQSQFITTFGIGSIIDLVGGSFVPLGLDDQNMGRDETQRIRANNLTGLLGVNHIVRSPAVQKIESSQTLVKSFQTIKATRFPKWYHDQKTGRLIQYSGQAGQNNLAALKPLDGKDSVRGLKYDSRQLMPARFLLAYVPPSQQLAQENKYIGCVSDFPWNEWAHTIDLGENRFRVNYPKEECKAGRHLYLRKVGNSHSLNDLVVECLACKESRRSMKGCYNLPNMVIVGYWPKMYRPWISNQPVNFPNNEIGTIRKNLRVIQRGGSGTWFPALAIVLDVPSSIRNEILDDIKDMRRLVENRGFSIEDVASLIAETSDFTAEELISAYSAEDDVYQNEYNYLSGTYKVEEHNFESKLYHVANSLSQHFQCVTQIRELREVRALIGFSRVESPNVDLNAVNQYLNNPGLRDSSPFAQLSATPRNWLPGNELFGEGIFIKLNQRYLAQWEDRAEVRNHAERLNEGKSARFYLLHTLAHSLIRSISLVCGYGIASLRERLYVSDTMNGIPGMCGILIYTASSDSDGTLGGLMKMAEPDLFFTIAKKAIEYSLWCSNDPICFGPADNRGPSSCHACTLLPETSCENQNFKLDRKFLVGRYGFFDNLV